MAEIWGNITGLLSDQTDLQNALDAKGTQIELDTKSNGFEKVTEEVGKTGWILKDNNGRLIANPVGDYSLDFTWQDTGNAVRVVGATGNYSFATGRNTLASGFNSFASGDGSIASGKNSAVFGLNNTVSGDYSFSFGKDNVSSGLQSVSIGTTNTTSTLSSFIGGSNSIIEAGIDAFQTGINGFAFGDNLVVNNPNQVSFGKYNLLPDGDNSTLYKIFTVGIGSIALGRQNGFEVFDGSGIERGSVKAPYLQQSTIAADTTGKVLITKEYFESAYNNAFDDAPIDGKIYGRVNKGWEEVAAQNSTQVYFKGTLPPPIDLVVPSQPGNFFNPGDVYIHYEQPAFITDGNLNDVDGDVALYDGNLGAGLSYTQYVLRDGTKLLTPGDHYWEKMTYGVEEAPQIGIKYNRLDGVWSEAAIQSDAPADGSQYARIDNTWSVVTSAEAPIVFKGTDDPTLIADFGLDGDNYMRTSLTDVTAYSEYTKILGTWTLIEWGSLAEAPIDGAQYVRKDGVWSTLVPEVPEVPNDGNKYVRQFGIWVQETVTVPDVLEAPIDGSSYVRNNGAWVSEGAAGGGDTLTLDKLLENADITNMTYDVDSNLSTITYGAYALLPAGYTSTYNYDVNSNLDTVVYNDNLAALALTITYTYDVNGNMLTMTRV